MREIVCSKSFYDYRVYETVYKNGMLQHSVTLDCLIDLPGSRFIFHLITAMIALSLIDISKCISGPRGVRNISKNIFLIEK